MRVYVIRHGQTAWNIQRRFLGRTDIPLDEEGLAQARCLPRAFPDCKGWSLWSSPLSRARQTAEVLGAPVLHPGLQEMDMGELEGMDRETIDRVRPGVLGEWFENPTRFRPPGGETLPETQTRITQAVFDILAQTSQGPLIIVSHQLAITGLLCHLTDTPLEQFRTFSHLNTAFSTLEWQDGNLSLIASNQTPHIPT